MHYQVSQLGVVNIFEEHDISILQHVQELYNYLLYNQRIPHKNIENSDFYYTKCEHTVKQNFILYQIYLFYVIWEVIETLQVT